MKFQGMILKSFLFSLVFIFAFVTCHKTDLSSGKGKAQKQASLKAITANYIQANFNLSKELNVTKHYLLTHCPVQSVPNYDKDGWYIYIPPYYIAKYIYLKAKYVTAMEEYKTQIQQYEHEGKTKFADVFYQAWGALNESDGGSESNVFHKGSVHNHRDLLTQYYEASSEWFKDDVEEIWHNYTKCTS